MYHARTNGLYSVPRVGIPAKAEEVGRAEEQGFEGNGLGVLWFGEGGVLCPGTRPSTLEHADLVHDHKRDMLVSAQRMKPWTKPRNGHLRIMGRKYFGIRSLGFGTVPSSHRVRSGIRTLEGPQGGAKERKLDGDGPEDWNEDSKI